MKKCTFEAAVLKYTHDAMRGEGLNIALLLVCPELRFAKAMCLESLVRISAAFPSADLAVIRHILKALQESFASAEARGLLLTDASLREIVREVLPSHDQAFDVSKTFDGITADPDKSAEQLFKTFVGFNVREKEHVRRAEEDVWQNFMRAPGAGAVFAYPQHQKVLLSAHMQVVFEHAWEGQEGRWQVAQPVSFDLSDPRKIKDKAAAWLGRLLVAKPSANDAFVSFLVAGPPPGSSRELATAATEAALLLEEELVGEARVYEEKNVERMIADLSSEIGRAAE